MSIFHFPPSVSTDPKSCLSRLRSTMLVRSHSERRALLGFSALLTHTAPKQSDETAPARPFTSRESLLPHEPLTSQPPWVSQALSNLEQGERELERLQERQQAEVEEVNRELDRAAFEAQREERRLLERIEKDHRETQQRLSQVKRENAAATRVVQSLVDQHLRQLRQLKEQVQRWGSTACGSNKHQLQRGVAEVTQPWEISLTLKRVNFISSPESTTFSLGEVDVREQGMSYPIGVCGVQGQKCALHSGDTTFSNVTPPEIRKEPAPNKGGKRQSLENAKTNSGKKCVVRKFSLSSSPENQDESNLPKGPTPRSHRGSESSQDEEDESVCSDTQGQDLFLAIPPVSSQGESEGDESDGKQWRTKIRFRLKGKKTQKPLVSDSGEEPSCHPEESDEKIRLSVSTRTRRKGSFSRHSPVDLSSSLSPQNILRSTESSLDSESPPSPVNSEDSSYIYPANESHSADVSAPPNPLTYGDMRTMRKVNRLHLASEHPTGLQGQGNECESDRSTMSPDEHHSRSPTPAAQDLGSKHVSTSAIDGDQERVDRSEGLSWELEDGGSTALDSSYLVKQFGKQGSGRTDFNLPSGIHATVNGQLFVVDCGNARIQVTDLQKNIVQQVSPSGSERSSRICNYFDVAVNSKGLIALTCAAERAVLVFSRHGRLLQTFGGTMIGSTNEELDAPRGVTVTRQDDFLVADIKRGTLTAFKLDPKTGARIERTVVTGYHRPYLVAACLTTGLMALSERGNDAGRVPCIRVLDPGWKTIRILGVCSGLGPVLSCPWGLCIDSDGDVLVADWGKRHHRVLFYPSKGVGWPTVTDNLSSPRGLALLSDGHVVVSDSMNHSIKIYRYK